MRGRSGRGRKGVRQRRRGPKGVGWVARGRGGWGHEGTRGRDGSLTMAASDSREGDGGGGVEFF